MLTLRPMSGYEVQKTIAGSIGNFWQESFGQIYPILRTLEERGWIREVARSKTREGGNSNARGVGHSNNGTRKRREFAATAAGRKVLAAWLKEPARRRVARNELLLKLFLGRAAGPATNLAHVEQFRAENERLLKHYAEIERYLNSEHAGNPHLPAWLTTLRYGQLESEAMLRWCDEANRLLAQIPPKQRGHKLLRK